MQSPAGGIVWFVWFLGQVAFRWVPGAVVSVVEGTPTAGPSPMELTAPVTAPQAADYLQSATAPGVYDSLFHVWSIYVAVAVLVSIGFAVIAVYSMVRMHQIRLLERRRFAAMQRPVAAGHAPEANLRWDRIQEEAHSDSEHAWRVAILEADIMLGDLLDRLGLRGETIGDKMRSADRADFRTLDLAWEAHRFRNQIAHEGDAREISAREVSRIIGLYERVFQEFNFVE